MKIRLIFLAALVLLSRSLASAASLPASAQAKVNEQFKIITGWAAESVIVDAVRTHNASVPADQAALTQDKWRALIVLDPLVRNFAKNPVGQFLKTKKTTSSRRPSSPIPPA